MDSASEKEFHVALDWGDVLYSFNTLAQLGIDSASPEKLDAALDMGRTYMRSVLREMMHAGFVERAPSIGKYRLTTLGKMAAEQWTSSEVINLDSEV